MRKTYDTYQKRRLISSYISVVISISLVLFLLGLLGVLLLNANSISNNFKEQVQLNVYFDDSAKDVEINQLKNSLKLSTYAKTVTYVSKEKAADFLKTEYGEDFLDVVGYNPLQNSLDVNFKAQYVTKQYLDSVSKTIVQKAFVSDIKYDKDLVVIMNNNVKRISFWVLVISGVFALIAILLINSSIRLAVYAKRFTIKTMQMVGATKRFIRRPFVWRSIRLGILGAFLALIALAVVLYYLDLTFPEIQLLSQPILIAGLFLVVFLSGVLITWFSTHIATQRFLNLNTDKLYY